MVYSKRKKDETNHEQFFLTHEDNFIGEFHMAIKNKFRHMKNIISIALLVLLSVSAIAETSITGEIRPRAELRDGYQTMRSDETEMAFFISQRSRLNIDYKDERYRFYLSVQDVRSWGDEKYNSDIASMALHEAWVDFHLSEKLTLKFGRQTVGLDNGLIMSPANWSQFSKKHDALRMDFKSDGWHLDVVNAFNQSSDKATSGTDYIYSEQAQGNYKNLHVLTVSKDVADFKCSLLGMAEGYQYAKDTVRTRFTYGTVIKYGHNGVDISGRLYGQSGRLVNGTEIAAWYGNLDASLKVDKSTFGVGAEIKSGNDYTDSDGKSHLFETPFGTKHAFNGSMDYFKSSSSTKNCGLTDYYLKYSFSLSEKTSFNSQLHYFTTTQSWYNSTLAKEEDSYLATELDITIKTKIDKTIKLEYGVSCLKGSNTLANMRGGDADKLNYWGYMMISFTPKFL